MIGYLEGDIIASDERSVIVMANGVGWRVLAGASTLEEWQKTNGPVKIFTHMHVREDAQLLFGFRTLEELRFFEVLIEVSGVGPRTAQHILDVLSLEAAIGAVQQKKADVFSRVPGIGSKTAQRIIIDIEPKLKLLGLSSEADFSDLADEDDAISALISLGYRRQEAREALRNVSDDVRGSAERVAAALKSLGKK